MHWRPLAPPPARPFSHPADTPLARPRALALERHYRLHLRRTQSAGQTRRRKALANNGAEPAPAAREHDSTTSDGPPSPPSPSAFSPSAFSPRAPAHGFCLVLTIRLSLSIWLSNSLDLPHHHHFATLSPSFSLLPYRGKRRALQCAIFA